MPIFISTEQIITYVLLALIILLVLWIIRLEIKIKKIPALKLNENLNQRIDSAQTEIENLKQFKQDSSLSIGAINAELKHTIQGIETVRFNPFKSDGVGGNQSFATAMIDQNGNGVIFSSLYSREKVSVFAKPIKNWNCEYEMSGEEKEVLEKMKNNKK